MNDRDAAPVGAAGAPSPRANLLGRETSPYLLQHKDNPVNWMAWGPEAFAQARAAGKPILLSIGYAACHWCHVMAHESFEDEATARLMNALFVNIKVDREERPDVDTVYQHALALLGEQGGWPLTMFLTPEGDPFWGGTYFPPEDRYGRPGFRRVLERIGEIYRAEGEKVRANVDALKGALGQLGENKSGESRIDPAVITRVARHFLGHVDREHGGLAGAPKFPQCAVFELLWREAKRSGDADMKDAVLLTLDRMCDGGIYDHLGGGFARYSTDAVWLAPHFEKMLYDNAQLIDLLTSAWQETGKPLYAERIAETIDWLLREMRVEDAAFAGTLDADSEGEEGRFYVWTAAEITTLLSEDATAFKRAYDVTPGGNWEGHTILNRRRATQRLDAAGEAQLAASRKILWNAREARVHPGRDDKVLADWNGLIVAALARTSQVFDRPEWLAAARTAFAFVAERMTENGRLRHSWCAGTLSHPATLDDHAAMARAAITLFETTGEGAYLAQAESWVGEIELRYRDPARGGYFLSADDVTDVIVRPKTAHDHATPSGNGILLHVFARLFHLTGKDEYRRRADALIAAFSGELERNALAMPVLMTGQMLLENAVQLVVSGAAEDSATRLLLRAAWRAAQPNLVCQRVSDPKALPEGHPAKSKAGSGTPAAYVCRGPVCSLPIRDSETLQAELAK
ncbi:MAG: thioredoxin domain-containing protein [Rhodospirillaceae bacterium]|nr:thioredoxin domain-containing protein [Rhodospirillaceae bacterium]